MAHAQAMKPKTIPSDTARAGICGCHTANAIAGASVASAENDTAPTSANATSPATARPYPQARNTMTKMPMRRSISTRPRKSPPLRAHAPRNKLGASQWLPIIKLNVSRLITTIPVAAAMPPR